MKDDFNIGKAAEPIKSAGQNTPWKVYPPNLYLTPSLSHPPH